MLELEDVIMVTNKIGESVTAPLAVPYFVSCRDEELPIFKDAIVKQWRRNAEKLDQNNLHELTNRINFSDLSGAWTDLVRFPIERFSVSRSTLEYLYQKEGKNAVISLFDSMEYLATTQSFMWVDYQRTLCPIPDDGKKVFKFDLSTAMDLIASNIAYLRSKDVNL